MYCPPGVAQFLQVRYRRGGAELVKLDKRVVRCVVTSRGSHGGPPSWGQDLPRKRVFNGDPAWLRQLACVYVSLMSIVCLSSTDRQKQSNQPKNNHRNGQNKQKNSRQQIHTQGLRIIHRLIYVRSIDVRKQSPYHTSVISPKRLKTSVSVMSSASCGSIPTKSLFSRSTGATRPMGPSWH